MARIELEGDETNLPQKVAKAKPKKPLVATPQKKQVVSNVSNNFMIKKPVAPAEQQEEMLTADEWAERLKAEEEAKQQQEAYPEEAEAEEQEDEENKLMTKEEFLAYMQKKNMEEKKDATLTTQKPAYAKRKFSIMDRLSANIDEALGVVPTPTAATTKPITKKAVPYNQVLQQQDIDDSQEIDNNLQEIPKGTSDWMGLKSNPVLAGAVTLVGLIMILAGTFMPHDVIAALTLEIIGLLIFVFGMVFVFGHVRRMVH